MTRSTLLAVINHYWTAGCIAKWLTTVHDIDAHSVAYLSGSGAIKEMRNLGVAELNPSASVEFTQLGSALVKMRQMGGADVCEVNEIILVLANTDFGMVGALQDAEVPELVKIMVDKSLSSTITRAKRIFAAVQVMLVDVAYAWLPSRNVPYTVTPVA